MYLCLIFLHLKILSFYVTTFLREALLSCFDQEICYASKRVLPWDCHDREMQHLFKLMMRYFFRWMLYVPMRFVTLLQGHQYAKILLAPTLVNTWWSYRANYRWSFSVFQRYPLFVALKCVTLWHVHLHLVTAGERPQCRLIFHRPRST